MTGCDSREEFLSYFADMFNRNWNDGARRRVAARIEFWRAIDVSLKREAHLRLQPAVVRGFEETLAVGPAGDLVREAKQRRSDIAGDRSGIGVIQQVLNGHRED